MAINVFLKDDINRLVKPISRKAELPAVGDKAAIGAKRGSARPSDSESTPMVVRREVISIYSSIILTEDGAFEKPPNWPTSGNYPAGFIVPDPLPPSLTYEGGVLSLDTEAAYYEQKRVHVSVVDNAGALQQDHYLVPLAVPYNGQGTYQGLLRYGDTNFTVDLAMNYFNNGNPLIQPLIDSLVQSGVVVE